MFVRYNFDASNPAHRKAYMEFRKNGKWGDSLRFKLEGEHISVPTMINQKLLDYYLFNDKFQNNNNNKKVKNDSTISVSGTSLTENKTGMV